MITSTLLQCNAMGHTPYERGSITSGSKHIYGASAGTLHYFAAPLLPQLASARSEQERLAAEARRLRDVAHEGHLAAVRGSHSGGKVHIHPEGSSWRSFSGMWRNP